MGGILAVPALGNDFLGLLDLLELARSPLLVSLILVGVVLPDELLELFLEPGAPDLLRPLLKVDGELEYLRVVPFRRPPVWVPSVFVEPVVLLAAVPHSLAVHRLLQLVVQLLLLLPVLALRVLLPVGDEIERRAKVIDGVVVVCIERFVRVAS